MSLSIVRTSSAFAMCSAILALQILPGPTHAQDTVRAWGDACGRGLVPNETRTTFETSAEQSFRDSFCGEWYRTHKQELEGSGGLRIAVVKLSADGSNTTEDVSHDKFCANPDYRTAAMTKWEVWAKTVSDDTRREFFRCVSRAASQSGPNSPVLLGTMEDTPQGLVASIRWDRNVTSRQPEFDSIQTVNLRCSAPYAPGKRISSNPQPFSCQWASAATQGVIVVSIRGGGGASRTFDRQLSRLGTASIVVARDEPHLKTTTKVYGTRVRTEEMHEKGCIPTAGPFGNLYARILGEVRARTSITDYACFDGRHGGYVYRFSVTPPDVGGRLKRPYGVECEADDRGSCEWNNDHPLAVLSESTDSVQFTKAYGSRSIQVRSWATEEIWDAQTIRRTPTWELSYDGFTFSFFLEVRERVDSFIVEWADRSSESVTPGQSSQHLRLVSANPSQAGISYTYRVSLSDEQRQDLREIGRVNARILDPRQR